MFFDADLINLREGMTGIALGDLEQTIPLGESLVPTPRDAASVPRPSAEPNISLIPFSNRSRPRQRSPGGEMPMRRHTARRELQSQTAGMRGGD